MYPSLWIIGLLIYLQSPCALVYAVVTFSPSLLDSRSLLTSASLIVAHAPSTTTSVKDACGTLSACKKRVLPYSKTLTIAVVGIFVACAIMAFLSVYVRRFCLRGGNLYVSYQSRSGPHRGNAALVKSLPVVIYEVPGDESKQTVRECAVCLSELQRGELLRVLPVCSHPFHKDCVDMWLFSHTTCPLCRGSIIKPKKGSLFSFA